MGFTVKRFKDYIYNELNNESRTRHMNDKAIQFEDAAGRKIKISPDAGVQVEDSEGTIIHDTPDCLIATGMAYGGHIYWKDIPGYMFLGEYASNSGATSLSYLPGVQNFSMTTRIPSDITNANGVFGFLNSYAFYYEGKERDSLNIVGAVRYGMEYNTTNYMAQHLIANYDLTQGFSNNLATGDVMKMGCQQQVFIPFTYDGNGVPNITIDIETYISNMATGAALYGTYHMFYVQGFLS